MTSLGLPAATIDQIIDDPTVLPTLSNPNQTNSSSSTSSDADANAIHVSASTARSILDGYTHGTHAVFILNAALATLCVFVSAAMIKHKELVRADEAEMRRRAREQLRAAKLGGKEKSDGRKHSGVSAGDVDVEPGEAIEMTSVEKGGNTRV